MEFNNLFIILELNIFNSEFQSDIPMLSIISYLPKLSAALNWICFLRGPLLNMAICAWDRGIVSYLMINEIAWVLFGKKSHQIKFGFLSFFL